MEIVFACHKVLGNVILREFTLDYIWILAVILLLNFLIRK